MQRKYLRLAEVRERYGNPSESKIYRLIRAGCFPPPRKMAGASLWDVADLDAHDATMPVGVVSARSAEAQEGTRRKVMLKAEAARKQLATA